MSKLYEYKTIIVLSTDTYSTELELYLNNEYELLDATSTMIAVHYTLGREIISRKPAPEELEQAVAAEDHKLNDKTPAEEIDDSTIDLSEMPF